MHADDQDTTATPAEPPGLPDGSAHWAQRRGKGLFWILMFSPAVICLIALTAVLQTSSRGADFLGWVLVPAFGICVYCGYWMASGFRISVTGKVFATIGLSLAFVLLNGILFFAGCFAVAMSVA